MKKVNLCKLVSVAIALTLVVACGKTKKEEKAMSKSEPRRQLIVVDTMMLKKRTFQKQIVCNGKLRAVLKSDLSFETSGVLTQINGMNGDYVKKGEVLAVLDTREALVELEKSHRVMEKASIDLQDKLIGQGYPADTTAVPPGILRNMKISSGYTSAVDQLEASRRRLTSCYLKAPFNGRVANLDAKIYDRLSDKLCTLIDDSYFDVEFSILEAEIGDVAVKQRVKIIPFINDEKLFHGDVTEINPLIDEHGQVKVRARVRNADRFLVEGMNVKVVLERDIENTFVVPKDAVVSRDGFQVVFRYQDGKAVWTYVDVVMSNIDSHAITGNKKKQTTISENDIVIVSNNLNLADGTDVTPNNKQQ